MKSIRAAFALCFTLATLLLLGACQSTNVGTASITTTNAPQMLSSRGVLTQDEANFRAQIVQNPHYKLDIDLTHTDQYSVQEIMTFTLNDSNTDKLFLDLDARVQLHSLIINGQNQSNPQMSKGHLQLPKASLLSGNNEVQMRFSRNYSTDGTGLYRFVDPVDSKVYNYTNFEPYDANKLFASFDQPNIKGVYQLKLTTPEAWVAVSNTIDTSHKTADGKTEWEFAESFPMSTYVFAVIAGDFKMWQDRLPASNGNAAIPLRLFARQSLAKYVDPKLWFTYTKQGLNYYQSYFKTAYPFKKYDQILAPDFNEGAMENIAAVTFNDNIPRSTPTKNQRRRLAEVILHEMAHMWFGDMVTMAWWDDLWLNESFATFMSYKSQAGATEFKDAWLEFFQTTKFGAYFQDQSVITHPIHVHIPSTQEAGANFDAITYNKGASVLRQLEFFLGEDNMRDGLKAYFDQHRMGNSTLADFLADLQTKTKEDLAAWSKNWLQTQGVDTVKPEFTCSDNKVTAFSLQMQNNENVDRRHRTQIKLFQLQNGVVKSTQAEAAITYGLGKTDVPQMLGKPCPDYIQLNDKDYDYAKAELDSRSLHFVLENMQSMHDEFLRATAWRNLYEMLRDAKLPASQFLGIWLKQIQIEKSNELLNGQMKSAVMALYYLPETTAEQRSAKAKFVDQVLTSIWQRYEQATASKSIDMQKLFIDAYTTMAETTAQSKRLIALLDGDKLDQDRRWNAVLALASTGNPRAMHYLEVEKQRDHSERGQKMAQAAAASFPSLDIKKDWLKKVEGTDFKYSSASTILWHMFPIWQGDLRKQFTNYYFDKLPELAKQKDQMFLSSFSDALAPDNCTEDAINMEHNQWVQNADRLPPAVIKALKRSWEENKRCQQARLQ